jgi:hypothetical protein
MAAKAVRMFKGKGNKLILILISSLYKGHVNFFESPSALQTAKVSDVVNALHFAKYNCK